MCFQPRARIVGLLLLCTVLMLSVPFPILSHPSFNERKTVLSVGLHDLYRNIIDAAVIADFEAQHPDIQIQVVTPPSLNLSPVSVDGTRRLQGLKELASTADVLFLGASFLDDPLPVEATRAGYFLDLKPLAAADTTLNSGDFYDPIWRAFQWDNGLWALPLSFSPVVLTYAPRAFDEAGLAYPTEHWTFDDLANAVRTLPRNASGYTVDVQKDTDKLLFLSLLNKPLVDTQSVPNAPQIAQPQFQDWLSTWVQFEQDGLVGSGNSLAPLRISPVATLLPRYHIGQQRAGVLLPGGKAGLLTRGFAVSAGSQHPELAYALAKYLTSIPAVSVDINAFGDIPARGSNYAIVRNRLTAEVQTLAMQALASGLTPADLRFADYLDAALAKMQAEGIGAQEALQTAQNQALAIDKLAAQQKATLSLAVLDPPLRPLLPAGKIALRFGVSLDTWPLPNRERWEKLAQSFIQTEPTVVRIDLDTIAWGTPFEKAAKNYDCFYLPSNLITADATRFLLNVDPLIDADPSIDKSDFVAGTLAQVQRDHKTWGVPITIEPAVLRYVASRFPPDTLTLLQNGWTVDLFTATLTALKQDGGAPPFATLDSSYFHWLLLIASYGGLPIDYRQDPPTAAFASSLNLQAIRQVLDLAKRGYIDYQPLGENPGQKKVKPSVPVIYPSILKAGDFEQKTVNSYDKPIPYPRGSRFTPLSYRIGTAYIGASAQNPEACFRWIKAISRSADLFSSMPTQRSMLDNSVLLAAQGTDAVRFYRMFAALADESTTIAFPYNGTSAAGYWLERWLYQAFDAYVLQNRDLEPALLDAQSYADAYLTCIRNSPNATDNMASEDVYLTCAMKADPRLRGT